MKDLLDKLSSYNIFNYLLPGIIFAVLVSEMTTYKLVQGDIVIGAFIYYFLGLIVSRFGSLVVEPLLKKIGFVHFAPYPEFIAASKKDEKLEVISEVNNMYRTLCSLFMLLLLLLGYQSIESHFPMLSHWNIGIAFGLIILLFLFSYRKQTAYVTKRVEANKDAQ